MAHYLRPTAELSSVLRRARASRRAFSILSQAHSTGRLSTEQLVPLWEKWSDFSNAMWTAYRAEAVRQGIPNTPAALGLLPLPYSR